MIWFERLLRPFLDIKKGEWMKVILTCLYFYLTITSYYIIKPARNTLFISYLGANNLPYVYLAIAAVSYYVSAVYTRFTEKFDNNKLVTISLLIIISNLLIFRWLFHFETSWFVPIVSFLFYVWVTLYSILTVTQFWVLANDVFDSQGAKRLYGFVGSGGILGGMTGGMIASYAKQLSTENLLLVSAVFIGLMIILFNIIWHREKKTLMSTKAERVELNTSKKESFSIIKQSRYLMLILILVGLIKVVTTQTEWQYNRFVELYVGSKDDMTVFFGQIFINLNIVALVIQLLFTSNILKRFGFSKALIPLPIGLFLGSAGILLWPQLFAASILKVSEGGLRYSINQTAKEYLFLPIPRFVRYKIKPFIDVFVYQFAKGFGAILTVGYLFLVVNVLHCSDLTQAAAISYVSVIFLAAWFITIYMLKKEYPNQVRQFLEVELAAHTKSTDADLMTTCSEYLTTASQQMTGDVKELLLQSRMRDSRIHVAVCVALHEGGKDLGSVQTLLRQIIKEDEKDERKEIPGDTQETANQLLDTLVHQTARNRETTISRLMLLREQHAELAFNSAVIASEIVKDITQYYKTFTIYELHESMLKSDRGSMPIAKDFLHLALRNILRENIDRIFSLLALVHPKNDIALVSAGLRTDNIYIRANALELFESMVQRKLRKKLMPLLDGELSVFGPERAGIYTAKMRASMTDALRDALKSDDRWLRICAMFLVSKCKIKALGDDVADCEKSDDPLLKEAARFILTKGTEGRS